MKKHALNAVGLIIIASLLALAFVFGPLFAFVVLLLNNTFAKTSLDGGKNLVDILNGVAGLFLVIAELVAIVITILISLRYIRYRRRYKFIFEGFSNAAELVSIENKPVDINQLAREELARQFKILYTRLRTYAKEWEDREDTAQPERTSFVVRLWQRLRGTNTAHTQEMLPVFLETEDQHSHNDLSTHASEWLLPNPGYEKSRSPGSHALLLSETSVMALVHDLQKTMASFESSGIANLANFIEESAPKEIAPLMHFIDAFVPAPVITVVCRLQWRHDSSHDVGIAFEIIDSGEQHVLKDQTLWKKPEMSSLVPRQQTLTEEYIELLQPAMRWLVLIFWELYTIKSPRLFKKNDTAQKKGFYYLLSALYYASADHFPAYADFFQQYGQISLTRVNTSPFFSSFYLAERAYAKSRESKNEHEKQKRINEAVCYYDQALKQIPEDKQISLQDTQKWITVTKALTLFVLENDKDRLKNINMQIEQIVQQESDPTALAPTNNLEDWSNYLDGLARWYANSKGGCENAYACIFLIDSFICDPSRLRNTSDAYAAFQEASGDIARAFTPSPLDDLKTCWDIILKKQAERSTQSQHLHTRKEYLDFSKEIYHAWWDEYEKTL